MCHRLLVTGRRGFTASPEMYSGLADVLKAALQGAFRHQQKPRRRRDLYALRAGCLRTPPQNGSWFYQYPTCATPRVAW